MANPFGIDDRTDKTLCQDAGRTPDAVCDRNCTEIELIVVDYNSADNMTEIARRHAEWGRSGGPAVSEQNNLRVQECRGGT